MPLFLKRSCSIIGGQLLRLQGEKARVSVGCWKMASVSFSSENGDELPKPAWVQKLKGSHEGIVVIHLNHPGNKNAISRLMLATLENAVKNIRMDDKARVLIIKSEVKNAFCAGADLKERLSMPVEEVPKFVSSLRQFITNLSELPVPSIAAIDGFALGGGLEMALGCDMRVASSRAKLGLPETKLAIFPGAGGSQRLPLLIGVARAKELIYTGRIISGTEAARIGLVNCVVDSEVMSAYQKSLEIASEILQTGPRAIGLAKQAIDEGLGATTLDEKLSIEKKLYDEVTKTSDRIEALKAFSEKRAPVFKGN